MGWMKQSSVVCIKWPQMTLATRVFIYWSNLYVNYKLYVTPEDLNTVFCEEKVHCLDCMSLYMCVMIFCWEFAHLAFLVKWMPCMLSKYKSPYLHRFNNGQNKHSLTALNTLGFFNLKVRWRQKLLFTSSSFRQSHLLDHQPCLFLCLSSHKTSPANKDTRDRHCNSSIMNATCVWSGKKWNLDYVS